LALTKVQIIPDVICTYSTKTDTSARGCYHMKGAPNRVITR